MKNKRLTFVLFCISTLSIINCSSIQIDKLQEKNDDIVGIDNFCQNSPDSCEDVSNVCEDADECDVDNYGGVKQEYVVKGCRVTLYNDGPVKMVDVNTNGPCDAPIPKTHKFYKKAPKVYQKDGCTITEYESADGGIDATKDCSQRKKSE